MLLYVKKGSEVSLLAKEINREERTDRERSGKDRFADEPKTIISPRLIDKFKNGDHQSFETIFNLFYPKVKAFTKVITKTDDLAEELTQQVFVDLWINREKIDPDRNMSAYIYTMARNSAITAVRQQLRFEPGDFDYEQQMDSSLTDDQLIARETELLVDLAVAGMPPKRREVYEMSRYDGKSNEEIAALMDISRKVVEKHLRLAMKDIRRVVRMIVLLAW